MTLSDRIAVLRAGRLDQVAPPLTVYHRPRTRFVAEFVGDSNIFLGTFTAAGAAGAGGVTVEGFGTLVVTAGAPSPRAGHPVGVLVRPERVRLAGPGDAGAWPNQVPLAIDTIVNYGDSLLVAGTARGRRLRLRLAGAPPPAIREGATVLVGWGPEDAHLFEAAPDAPASAAP